MSKTLADFEAEAKKTVAEVQPEDIERMMADGWVLLDVREADEFEEGHIPGAISIPRGFLEVRADHEHHKRDPRLQDRSQRLLCYCGGGHRSLLAAKTLLEMGFAGAVSMAGGWRGWVAKEDTPADI